jgi:hypothetical protein
LCIFFVSPVLTKCAVHLILFDFITLVIKLWSSSLCNFLHPPFTTSLLGPNVFLSTLFSHSSYVVLFTWQTKFHTHKAEFRLRKLWLTSESDRMIGVRLPAGDRNFYLQHSVQTGSGVRPASHQMGTRGSFPGG